VTAILEAVGAGTTVAFINRFIISINWLWSLFLGCTAHPTRPNHDDVSDSETINPTSTTATEALEIHTHF
jgi:hypothetical protein